MQIKTSHHSNQASQLYSTLVDSRVKNQVGLSSVDSFLESDQIESGQVDWSLKPNNSSPPSTHPLDSNPNLSTTLTKELPSSLNPHLKSTPSS
jgi:hypothetical protein